MEDEINGLIDFEVVEIRNLEIEAAKNSRDREKCLQLLIRAIEVAKKHLDKWVCPATRDTIQQHVLHLLDEAERLKSAPCADAYTYPVFAASDEVFSIAEREPVPFNLPSNKQQQILLLQRSKFGGNTFPPWPADGITPKILNKTPKVQPTMSLSEEQKLHFKGWSAPREALGAASRDGAVVMETDEPLDLIQDISNDCSVVASISALMAHPEVAKKLLSQIMHPAERGDAPLYFFQFYFNGCKRAVEVSPLLPVTDSERVLHVVDRNIPSLLWPALLEKAYLTLWGGYDFEGSNSNADLLAITGWIPELVMMHAEGVEEDRLWPKLWKGFKSKTLVATFGTSDLSKQVEKEYGLVRHHAYALLDLKVDNNEGYLLLKNPWKHTKTIWEAGSSSASTFWIPLTQAKFYFKWAYLNWNPGIFQHRVDISFTWTIERPTAPRCPEKTPQFALRNPSNKPQIVWLLLIRHFQDLPNGGRHASGHISIHVCSNDGNKVYDLDMCTIQRSRSVNSSQVLLRYVMPASTTYTLVPRQDDGAIGEHHFSLVAFCDAQIELSEAKDPFPHKFSIAGHWTLFNAVGSIAQRDFYKNPQYSLEIPENNTRLALSLESWNTNMAVNLMIYHNHGQQVFSVTPLAIDHGSEIYHTGGYTSLIVPSWKPLPRGKYTVLMSTREPEQVGSFTLHCESNNPITMTLIRGEEWWARYQVPRAAFAPEVNVLAIPLTMRRGASVSLRVVIHHVANSAGASNSSAKTPMCIRVERGDGPDDRQVIAETGTAKRPFTDVPTQGLRLLDVSVPGKCWLVLERIAVGSSSLSTSTITTAIATASATTTAAAAGAVGCWDVTVLVDSARNDEVLIGEGWIVRDE